MQTNFYQYVGNVKIFVLVASNENKRPTDKNDCRTKAEDSSN